ncbi:MAG: hypothetical protein AMJ65_09740 [Phycisphaerae bacterium SG8_4]|nr:MAG: hypothetical protein AMJ65_09740 [Phycisphaerae bacterium SG8_4]
MITVPTLLMWWINKDKDWYRELQWRDKFLHWWFECDWPEPTLIKIPRAFEIGTIFGALPEALAEAAYEEDPDAMKAWMSTLVDVAYPGVMPVLGEEAWEQASNFDYFWETKIVPRGELDLPPEEQIGPYTSKVAITLGQLFKVSPRRIDHAVAGIFGPVGRDILETLGIGPKETEREKGMADAWIIGRLFSRGKLPYSSLSVERAYNRYGEVMQRSRSRRHIETEDEREERLLLEDAIRAITLLGYVHQYTGPKAPKETLRKQRIQIARDVLRDLERGRTSDYVRERYRKERKKAEKQYETVQKRVRRFRGER